MKEFTTLNPQTTVMYMLEIHTFLVICVLKTYIQAQNN